MVAPQMPTGRLIGQAVLHHQANGQGDHAIGVLDFRQGQVGHVGVEVFIALRAMVNRIREGDVVRTTRDQIPQIMQHSMGLTIPVGTVSAMGAWLFFAISTAFDDFRFGQVFDASDAFRGIRQVFTWSWHGMTLLGCCQAEILAKLPLCVIIKSR
jgi:hypothetical protein